MEEVNNKLYMYKGEYDIFLKENFVQSIEKDVEIFVWQNLDRSLGFNNGKNGYNFLSKFVSNSFTILIPEFASINDQDDILENINNFRGVSFWGDIESVKQSYDELLMFRKQQQKNKLLKRYGRKLIDVSQPEMLKWVKDNKYTENFTSFIERNKLEYAIWSFSDFGIYFFKISANSFIRDKVARLCMQNKCTYLSRTDINKMPYY